MKPSTAETKPAARVKKGWLRGEDSKGNAEEVLVSISPPLTHQKDRGRPARAPCQRRHLARATTAPSKCLQLFDITCEDHVGIPGPASLPHPPRRPQSLSHFLQDQVSPTHVQSLQEAQKSTGASIYTIQTGEAAINHVACLQAGS